MTFTLFFLSSSVIYAAQKNEQFLLSDGDKSLNYMSVLDVLDGGRVGNGFVSSYILELAADDDDNDKESKDERSFWLTRLHSGKWMSFAQALDGDSTDCR